MTNAIGWLSSAILISTVGSQVLKQWRERSSEGVSPLLFGGQIAASIGFTSYSALALDWVNLVTNLAMLAVGVTGGVLTWRYRKAGLRPT